MGKLKLREVQYFAKGHETDKWQNQDLNPDDLDSKARAFLPGHQHLVPTYKINGMILYTVTKLSQEWYCESVGSSQAIHQAVYLRFVCFSGSML